MKNTMDYFKEICAIPHGSYNIDKISDYLVEFAKENNLSYRQDELKNVIIKKMHRRDTKTNPELFFRVILIWLP